MNVYKPTTKKVAAGVIFLNEKKEILLVKPTYREGWLFPGGAVDDNESPLQAAVREVKEELDLDIESPTLRFVCVHYLNDEDRGEGMNIVFYGGVLSSEVIKTIKLPTSELSDHTFFSTEETLKHLNNRAKKRFMPSLRAIETGIPVYIETSLINERL